METQTLIEHLGAFSYLGIFGVSMIANIAIVLPEEIILLAIGYVVGTGVVNGFIVVPIVMLGLLITDTALYTLSKRRNRLIMFFYDKFFAWRVKNYIHWLKRHIYKVIFFSRFMVQLRFMGPFFAGQLKIPRRKFILYEVFALAIYVPLLVWAGAYFRNRIERITDGIRTAHNLILIGLGTIILFVFLKFLRNLILKSFKKEA